MRLASPAYSWTKTEPVRTASVTGSRLDVHHFIGSLTPANLRTSVLGHPEALFFQTSRVWDPVEVNGPWPLYRLSGTRRK